MQMEARDRRVENPERALGELIGIHAWLLGIRARRFRMWPDLAIRETAFKSKR